MYRTLIRSSCFSEPPLDTQGFVPVTMDSASAYFNCLCSAIHTVLTGCNKRADVLEELLLTHRRGGPYSYLYNLPWADPMRSHPEHLEYACSADFLVLARTLRVSIMVSWPAKGDLPARWVKFSGHDHGSTQNAIYLAHVISRKQGHVIPVTGLRLI